VIKPFLEVLESNTGRVLFTAAKLNPPGTPPVEFVFSTPGSYIFRSEVYPFVKGIIEVKEPAQEQQVRSHGKATVLHDEFFILSNHLTELRARFCIGIVTRRP
jgi:hypothetical protein